MHLKLGFTTCPNDTFIFDAMVHHKVDTEGLIFMVTLADVAELNEEAMANNLHVTKISYYAYAHVANRYAILDSGSALGHGNGPLLIAKEPLNTKDLPELTIAIPGEYTTANLLLSLAFPDVQKKEVYLFSEIEEAILNGEVDAGVIIHENRFTYQEKGLYKIVDLGEQWEKQNQMPIPLGGIVVSRDLSDDVQQKINRVMTRSVAYALENPDESMEFVKAHAQEMGSDVIRQHINLYVNEYSKTLGGDGRSAIEHLFKQAQKKKLIPHINQPLFV